jgi:peptide/nickel transport system permease protein
MKHTLRQVFRSGKFVTGFVIFTLIVLWTIFYPIIVPADPLEIIGQGTFFAPGIYVNVYDSVAGSPRYTIMLDDAEAKRVASKLGDDDRLAIKEWLVAAGIPEGEIDTTDTEALLTLWVNTYNPSTRIPGMTNADRNYFIRLNNSLEGLLSTEGATIAAANPDTGTLEEMDVVAQDDYVNVTEVPNVRVFVLGTDNFGRDVLTQLVTATAVSLRIGFVAGILATSIGLILGLLAGYMGGLADDLISFATNLMIVIPSIVLLILISFSIGQEQRGAFVIAIVIGLTAWPWTARAVRAQVISLRNRDHVSMSKLSGHSLIHIIFRDIFPYIASYVIMAFILQISAAILAEANLSILGLGPRTTDVPTLGLMMNWAMIYQAHILGFWWAYVPVITVITLIAFSLLLMNTGMDHVFNPQLRD